MSISKKILTAALALLGSVCIAVALFFVPAISPSAETLNEVAALNDFTIDNGEFKGLSTEGLHKVGQKKSKIVIPASVTKIAAGGQDGENAPATNLLFKTAAPYIAEIQFADASKIVTVGESAFAGCTSLARINLSEATNLTEIGAGAFRNCSSLETLSVSSNKVTAIPANIARGCASLTTLRLTDSVESIGDGAFFSCGEITSFTFPVGLKTIGNSAFYYCAKLTSLEVPSTVTSIGESAFSNCSALTEIVIPDTLTGLSKGVFQNCTKLTKLNAADGVNFNIPSSATVIGDRAFSGCISLETVTIPAHITDIGLEAFFSCQAIKTINYYAEAAAVQSNPFALPQEAYAASNVTVNIGSADACVKQLPSGLFCKVGEVSADGHKGITAVNFVNVELTGEGENGWGYNVFKNCTSLKTVTFSKNCTIPVIKLGAFDGCTALTGVSGIKDIQLETIGEAAFQNCTALFNITLGTAVKSIGPNAFLGCERLIEVVNLSSLNIERGSVDNGRVAENALAVYTTEQTKIDTSNPNGFVFFSNNNAAYLLGYTGNSTEPVLPVNYNGNSYQIYKKAFYCNTDITEVAMSESKITHIGASAFAGCTSLNKIAFPAELVEVGETLLQGCTSLSNVTFNGDRLTNLTAGMFSGCGELVSVTLPKGAKTIGFEAFKDCNSLTTVNFGNILEQIGGSAFSGCSRLEVVSMPATVKNVGAKAFEGCLALSVVYLPSDDGTKTVQYGANVFDNSSSNLILISRDKAQYDKDSVKNNLSVYQDKLTYMITLKLIYDDGKADGGIHEVNRLFGRVDGAGYVQNGLNWIQTPSMPQQDDYSVSKWFTDTTYTKEVKFDDLTQMLNKPGVEQVSLYARYIKKPNLVPKLGSSSPVYFEGMSYGIEEIIKNCFTLGSSPIDDFSDFGCFRFSIPTHYFVNKDKDNAWNWDPTTGKVDQAGTYKLIVELEANTYGAWSSSIELEFEIRPLEIDISDKILWKPDGNSSLHPLVEEGTSKTLYFYGDKVPYLEQHENEMPSNTVDVINSYTIYTGGEITIHLTLSTQYGTVVESSYENNVGKEAGTYNAKVTLQPGNNYTFKYEVTPTPPNLEKLGLSFRRNLDGTMTVAKNWYIAISGANHLTSADGGMYNIVTDDDGVAWNYLGETANIPARPSLSLYAEEAYDLITFTLKFNGEIVGNANKLKLGPANERVFERYVNSAMPAGDYELTFYIGDKNDGNNVVTGNPNGKTFVFRVGEATLKGEEVNDIIERKLSDTSLSYNGEVRFASTASIDLLDPDNPSHPHAVRTGIWLEKDFDDYYRNFAISYYVKEGQKKNFAGDPDPVTYYPISAYPGGVECAVPISIGTYTVFYRIAAPSFGTEIKGRYELNITHTLTIDKFVLSPIEFANGSVIDRVLMQLQDKVLDGYDVFTLRSEDKNNTPQSLLQFNGGSHDSYTSLGDHYVFILIKEAKKNYIVWDDSISKSNFTQAIINGTQRDDFLVVKFEIVATQNREITPLSVNKWEYGEFTREDNQPNWVLQFNDDYTKYSFVLTSKTDENEKYYFYGDPKKPLGENQLGFDKAPAGEYILTATAPADDSIGVYAFVKECDVKVDKATPRFTAAPFIDSWNYGNYKKSNVTPDFELGGLGAEVKNEIKLKYCTDAEFVKPEPKLYDIETLLDTSGQLPVGTYYLVYILDGTDDFEPWQYGVRFRVLRAENYWDKTPVIHDWVYGEYASRVEAFDYKPHFGDASSVQIQYRTAKSSWVNSIEELNGFDNITKELAVGTYEFRAVVGVSANYNSLTFQTTFNVTKTLNSWNTVPGIKSWAQGRYTNENRPTAEAKFGNNAIVYTVTDDKGNTYDINNLASLKVGNYKLTATIAGNDNYEELSSVVYFNVLEDSVGMTGLMVATIIFSVIAFGLAAAGITLLVLRNRKAEAEFRKAVKNELRRK